MDAQGRVTDEHGNVVLSRQHHELKINETKIKDNKTKDLEKIMKYAKSGGNQGQIKKKFFDQTLEQSSVYKRMERRRKTGLQFIEQGTYVKRGEIMRRKQAQSELEHDPLLNFGA